MPNFQIVINAQGILTTVPLTDPPATPPDGLETCPLGHAQVPYVVGKVAIPGPVAAAYPMLVADEKICSACGIRYAINFVIRATSEVSNR